MNNIPLPAINQRIRELIDELSNGNVSAFCSTLGYNSAQKVNRLFNIDPRTGKYPTPSSTIITDISNTFHIQTEWIIKGTSAQKKNDTIASTARPVDNIGFMNVPIIHITAKCGYLAGYEDQEYLDGLPTMPVIVDKTYHGSYRVFEAEGDSMDNGSRNSICDGDKVLVREVKRELWHYKLHIKDWLFVIATREENIVIKQIIDHNVENNTITVHSFNPIFQDYTIKLDEVIELYNVIKIVDRNVRL